MFEHRSEEQWAQCLKDSGCNKKKIADLMECRRCEKKVEEISLMKNHRRALLDQLHRSQKQIDCLDYLIYQLEKRED